ncbi:hypothetical protein CLU81_3562 [Flavobacterium sp. 9]|uniref:hypothetical protein n=1 Tax=Flavobacterium sp. 9 TaxID=2035198 RepID=UPI000C1870C5|nr:hypothetical protein [Flavobacterium sp. 9]PIF32992.1 hypothetical protein CLU81_3562 [Flavobacterium sp. 9]
MSILASNNPFPHDPDDNWRLKTDKGGCELTAQQLLDKIEDIGFPDDILVHGAVVKALNKMTIAAFAFTCRINHQVLTNPDAFETTIAVASEGFKRIDILVFTKFATIVKIQGTESIDSAEEPATPPDTIKISFVSVFGDLIDEPVIPIETFVTKMESQDFIASYGATAVIERIELIDVRSSISLTGAITDVKSIQVSGEFMRPGKPFFIKNKTGHDVKLWHLSGTGNVKIFFPNTLNFTVKNNEVVQFNLNANDSSNVRLEYVGVAAELGYQISSASEKVTINDNDKVGVSDSEDSNKTKYWKFSTIKSTLKTYFDTFYLTQSTDQNVSGIKTFLTGKFGLRNVANTFTSFFTNANTASRTYTFQNRNGTLLDDTDLTAINTSIATKQTVFTGIANYVTKSLNATTLTVSRLFDNGTFLGIGTMNTPLKDITLGYQADREIGIEDSDNTTVGRNLRISAGRTINYIANVNFIPLNQASRNWSSITVDLNGDVYAGVSGGDIYKQVGGGGIFTAIGQLGLYGWNSMATAPNRDIYVIQQGINIFKKTLAASTFTVVSTGVTVGWEAITVAPNGDVYACSGSADIYKQTGGTGTYVALGQTSRNWRGICAAPNGDIYACVINGDIYKQTGGTGNFVALGQTSRIWKAMAASPSGDIYACTTGAGADIYKQSNGMGNFVAMGQTVRNYQSLAVAPNGNVYTTTNGDMYYQQNNATGASNLDGGNLDLVAGTGKGNAKSRLRFITGAKTASGSNMQTETVRAYIDENGFMIWNNMPTYPDNAAALTGGLPVGCEYKTATGDRKIVY